MQFLPAPTHVRGLCGRAESTTYATSRTLSNDAGQDALAKSGRCYSSTYRRSSHNLSGKL